MIRLFSLLVLLIVLSACPYQAEHPLDAAPKQKADSTLAGLWLSISESSKFETLSIGFLKDSIYQITRRGKVQSGDMTSTKTLKMNAFSSVVENQLFLNIEKPDLDGTGQSQSKSYFIVKYRITYGSAYDTLTTGIVDKNSFASYLSFKNSREFREAVAKKIKGAALVFDTDYSATYIRRAKNVN